jgi:predicted AlkP superfamily pyrophosphatase or phosphodiesterase
MTFNTLTYRLGVCLGLTLLMLSGAAKAQDQNQLRTIILMFDGLRPDYITPELMPNLYRLAKQGSYGKQHHSVFPTVTRVNSASYATGSYPARHGLMGNAVFFPEISKTKGLNTGEAAELKRITEATGDHLLTAVSLGEVLQAAGKKLMVFSSGTTGQAFLQNHKVSGGAIINPDLILPASFEAEVLKTLGPAPAAAKPNTSRHKWVTDAFFRYGLAADGPLVSAIWYSDPDASAHSHGIGSPVAKESIRIVDGELGRILEMLETRDLTNTCNIVISTDHGFVTHVGTESLADYLIQKGVKKAKDSDDVVVVGGAIYVKNREPEAIKKVVALLQARESVGAIFTKGKKAGDMKGFVEGTLSFAAIHWDHPSRSADILVVENWDNRKNEAGYEGTGFAQGVAGHGGSSPYEIHIPLIAAGPGFKKGFEGNLPTSNVDIVPTVLYLHGLAIPGQMDGRVMSELLMNAPAPASNAVEKQTIEARVKKNWGTYQIILERSVLGKYNYVNYTKVTRTFLKAEAK